jgi:hypothetical protein
MAQDDLQKHATEARLAAAQLLSAVADYLAAERGTDFSSPAEILGLAVNILVETNNEVAEMRAKALAADDARK